MSNDVYVRRTSGRRSLNGECHSVGARRSLGIGTSYACCRRIEYIVAEVVLRRTYSYFLSDYILSLRTDPSDPLDRLAHHPVLGDWSVKRGSFLSHLVCAPPLCLGRWFCDPGS